MADIYYKFETSSSFSPDTMEEDVRSYWGERTEKKFILPFWRADELVYRSPSSELALKVSHVDQPDRVEAEWVSFNPDKVQSTTRWARVTRPFTPSEPDITYFVIGPAVYDPRNNENFRMFFSQADLLIVGRLGRTPAGYYTIYFSVFEMLVQQAGTGGGSGYLDGIRIRAIRRAEGMDGKPTGSPPAKTTDRSIGKGTGDKDADTWQPGGLEHFLEGMEPVGSEEETDEIAPEPMSPRVPTAGREPTRSPGGGLEGTVTRGGLDEPEVVSSPPDTSESTTFEAYPHISDPGPLEAQQNFQVTVKFSKELDKGLEAVPGAFVVERPAEDDYAEVSLMAKGATISDNGLARLFLNLRSSATFDCSVNEGAREVVLVASFYYKKQPMTMATRRIVVGVNQPAIPDVEEVVETPEEVCALNIEGIYYEEHTIDLTVSILFDEVGKKLIWEMVSPITGVAQHRAEVDITDTRSFARDIGAKMAAVSYAGKRGGKNALETIGQSIADCIPPVFFSSLQEIFERENRPPRLLIWTEEPYIPWELTYDNRLQFDPAYDPILSLQVSMGRWLKKKRVVYPLPASLDVQHFSTMAGDYSGSFTHAKLEEALKEKEFLVNQFQAQSVEALIDPLLELTEQQLPGHLLHMALHGVSRPDLNEQLISLQDGDLLAETLSGAYSCGDIPAISFLFLNACQVGMPGDTLGQASGFPGILLSKGIVGFIAPIWNVHDIYARPFCEQFYRKTFEEKQAIGEVLLALRRQYAEHWRDTLTHVAYIYYGHPGMTLKKPDLAIS